MPRDPHAYRARWIFPVASEPIEDGTIEIDKSGRIAGIHDRRDTDALALGDVAIIPGLINAHTHLEFSDLERPLEPRRPFDGWIRALVAHRRSRAEPVSTILRRGLEECRTSGTTLVGEIATSDSESHVYESSELPTVVFRELIGFQPEQTEGQLEIARAHLQNPHVVERASTREAASSGTRGASPAAKRVIGRSETAGVIHGLSPHAPYSVHPELFGRAVELAAEHGAPLAVHLAETRAELDFLCSGGGPLVEMLREFGVPPEGIVPRGTRPLDYLQPLSELGRGLVIHGNYLSDAELDFLAEHENLTLVYCPRTHAFFGHADHPWRKLLKRGGRVALGTDSRASNPDLSVWRELCYLRARHPDVPPRLLLQLATTSGAEAFGLQEQTGSLRDGRRADVAVVSLHHPGGSDPYSLLFETGNNVVGTMCGGAWVYRHRSLCEV